MYFQESMCKFQKCGSDNVVHACCFVCVCVNSELIMIQGLDTDRHPSTKKIINKVK